jgi:ketosteroid isomerase-like protein
MKFSGTGRGSWLRPLIIRAALVMCGAAFFGTAFFGPLLGTLSAQQRGADDAVTAKVLSLEQLWNQAEVQKDTHSLNQLLADNFIYVDIDGSLIKDKAEFLASVTSRAEHIESIRGESMLSQVHGDTVIVTGVYHEKGTLNGKPYLHHGRFTDTWVKEGSAWLCAASQSTLIQK